MSRLFKKLNFRDQRQVAAVSAPESLNRELEALAGIAVKHDPQAAKSIEFVLAVVTRLAEVKALA